MPSPPCHTAFATCPRGMEGLLLAELQSLGVAQARETVAGVQFSAELATLYRLCLWSRLANRVLLQLVQFPVSDADGLYRGVQSVDWRQHLGPGGSLAVDFTGTGGGIRNTHFGAQRVKDAVVDQLREGSGTRPAVDTQRPDLRIHVRLRRDQVVLSIDLSGDSLHRRGYRRAGGAAPLKENLACALLLRADWPGVAAAGGALVDPLCGSGTLLIEGALMAMGIAPGLLRGYWGFTGWRGHQPKLWEALVAEARAQREQALARRWPLLQGYDASGSALQLAEQNIAAAGLGGRIRLKRAELQSLSRPADAPASGLLITNPPYGERLGEETSLAPLYRFLGGKLKEAFAGWQAAVFTGNPELGKTMGLRARKQYALYNGPIPCKLLLFDVAAQYFVEQHARSEEARSETHAPLSEGAQMFANRLRKNQRKLKKWLQRENIQCYRLYDADMPEYAVAVDIYDDWAHVAEYRPPASVDASSAEQRLRDVLLALPQVLAIPAEQVVLKQRERQRGAGQYRKRSERAVEKEVLEHGARLLVNFTSYLDTGLFLDHRPVRREIAQRAKGQRFLNLFCYTATATVHAALGGARFSTSVDLSPTYLRWAARNLALNGISEHRHRLVQADCFEWLADNTDVYDLILLDPPTFSNSKRSDAVLDTQRDHAQLIDAAMVHLAKDGVLIFSTNKRGFKLDSALTDRYAVEDVTGWSLDPDFQRRPPIHRCWFFRPG